MGYYTRHELEHDDTSYPNGGRIDHDEGITAVSGYQYSVFDDEIKWYDHEKDMRKYSKKFPKVTFIISGVGEEEEDYWKEYHKNGKMLRCKGDMKVTYEPFDERGYE
jgi:hypothetical protein